MKTTNLLLRSRYLPALLKLSEQDNISGKIAYACAKCMAECNKAFAYYQRSRTMILSSRALKEADGKTFKQVPVMKQDGLDRDGNMRMIPELDKAGNPILEYGFESQEKKNEALAAVNELDNTEIEIDINRIPASEIIQLKNLKGGGRLIFDIGDMIDHDA